MIEFLIDFWLRSWPSGAVRAYRREQRRARQRERVFCATQAAIARHRAEESWSGGLDYFTDRDSR